MGEWKLQVKFFYPTHQNDQKKHVLEKVLIPRIIKKKKNDFFLHSQRHCGGKILTFENFANTAYYQNFDF